MKNYRAPAETIRVISDTYVRLTAEWKRILGGTDLQEFLNNVVGKLCDATVQELEIDKRELVLLCLVSSELGLSDIFQSRRITSNDGTAVECEEIRETSRRLKKFYEGRIIGKLIKTDLDQGTAGIAQNVADAYSAEVLREEQKWIDMHCLPYITRPKHEAYLLQGMNVGTAHAILDFSKRYYGILLDRCYCCTPSRDYDTQLNALEMILMSDGVPEREMLFAVKMLGRGPYLKWETEKVLDILSNMAKKKCKILRQSAGISDPTSYLALIIYEARRIIQQILDYDNPEAAAAAEAAWLWGLYDYVKRIIENATKNEESLDMPSLFESLLFEVTEDKMGTLVEVAGLLSDNHIQIEEHQHEGQIVMEYLGYFIRDLLEQCFVHYKACNMYVRALLEIAYKDPIFTCIVLPCAIVKTDNVPEMERTLHCDVTRKVTEKFGLLMQWWTDGNFELQNASFSFEDACVLKFIFKIQIENYYIENDDKLRAAVIILASICMPHGIECGDVLEQLINARNIDFARAGQFSHFESTLAFLAAMIGCGDYLKVLRDNIMQLASPIEQDDDFGATIIALLERLIKTSHIKLENFGNWIIILNYMCNFIHWSNANVYKNLFGALSLLAEKGQESDSVASVEVLTKVNETLSCGVGEIRDIDYSMGRYNFITKFSLFIEAVSKSPFKRTEGQKGYNEYKEILLKFKETLLSVARHRDNDEVVLSFVVEKLGSLPISLFTLEDITAIVELMTDSTRKMLHQLKSVKYFHNQDIMVVIVRKASQELFNRGANLSPERFAELVHMKNRIISSVISFIPHQYDRDQHVRAFSVMEAKIPFFTALLGMETAETVAIALRIGILFDVHDAGTTRAFLELRNKAYRCYENARLYRHLRYGEGNRPALNPPEEYMSGVIHHQFDTDVHVFVTDKEAQDMRERMKGVAFAQDEAKAPIC